MTDDKRPGREASIEQIMLENGWMSGLDAQSWTEAEWADHDAKIAAERAALESQTLTRYAFSSRQRMVDDGWPVRALEAAEEADHEKPAVLKILSWGSDAQNVIVLSGPPGCGKTTAAAVWALKRSGVVFLRATTFAAASRYDAEKREHWFTASSLVLDDLGSEYADAKGNFLVDLDELVDTFYGDKRPLLITTNATAAEFKNRYGQRIVDRLRECGVWFEIGTGSLRRKP